MKEVTNGPLEPEMIGRYPNVSNRQGSWATAVWDKRTLMWYVQSFTGPYSAIMNHHQYKEPRFGNMYLYECRWKDKWLLIGMLDNSVPEETTMSHPPARGGRKKTA